MRICHFSDWHGQALQLPEADLYVCTGDMLTNHPVKDGPKDRQRMAGGFGWRIDPENERELQAKQVAQFVSMGGMRKRLGSPDAPVVCVRGNHDFIDLQHLFEGCNFIHEFVDNELVEVAGLKIAGHRGIPYIFGSWADEENRADLKDRYRRMPFADVYLTHYPPAGILDSSMPPWVHGGGAGESYGLEGLADFFLYRSDRALHCFGHIHECGGYKERHGTVWFSNAACSINEIDF